MTQEQRINIDLPRYDQTTFLGRFKHFASITDWRTALYPSQKLVEAKDLLDLYRNHQEPPGTTEEDIWFAKKLYSSAFHPDSGELQNLIGRMSFQVPGGMLITGCLLQFYKTAPQVVFWQWVNQSFNALVNYTNRNAQSSITNTQIGVAYASATTAATAVALGLNSLVKNSPPLLARYVPFAAVAAANCINIPLMRQRELSNGIMVFDEDGNALGTSQRAAIKSITQVTFSRITMAAPGMLIIPVIMERLEKYPFMQRLKRVHALIQVMLCGVSLSLMVPTACAMFPQRCSMLVSSLEPDVQQAIREKYGDKIDRVYFNKGL